MCARRQRNAYTFLGRYSKLSRKNIMESKMNVCKLHRFYFNFPKRILSNDIQIRLDLPSGEFTNRLIRVSLRSPHFPSVLTPFICACVKWKYYF